MCHNYRLGDIFYHFVCSVFNYIYIIMYKHLPRSWHMIRDHALELLWIQRKYWSETWLNFIALLTMLLNNHGHRPFCIDRIAGIALLLAWNDRTVMLFVFFSTLQCNAHKFDVKGRQWNESGDKTAVGRLKCVCVHRLNCSKPKYSPPKKVRKVAAFFFCCCILGFSLANRIHESAVKPTDSLTVVADDYATKHRLWYARNTC